MKELKEKIPSRQISFLKSLLGLVLVKVGRYVSKNTFDLTNNLDEDPSGGPYLLEFEGEKKLFVDGYPDDQGDNLLVYNEVASNWDFSDWVLKDSSLSFAWSGCLKKPLKSIKIILDHEVEAGLEITFSDEAPIYVYNKDDDLYSSRLYPFSKEHSSCVVIS